MKLEPTRISSPSISRRRRKGQIIVGFAAETENLVENAAAKLRAKQLDLLVANDVSQKDAGFDVDTNIVTLLFPDGRKIGVGENEQARRREPRAGRSGGDKKKVRSPESEVRSQEQEVSRTWNSTSRLLRLRTSDFGPRTLFYGRRKHARN